MLKSGDLGLGFRMKLAHRKLALAAGISSICWTYDPLQSRNALDLIVTQAGTQTVGGPRNSTINGLTQSTLNVTLDGIKRDYLQPPRVPKLSSSPEDGLVPDRLRERIPTRRSSDA